MEWTLLYLLSLLACFIVSRLIWVACDIWVRRSSQSTKNGTKRVSRAKLMVVLGSGGHTTEMLKLVSVLSKDKYLPPHFVVASTDSMSIEKLKMLKCDVDENSQHVITTIPRSREVFQSWRSTVLTTFHACLISIRVIFTHRPDVLLCNGPGTCVPLCYAAFLSSCNHSVSGRHETGSDSCSSSSMSSSGSSSGRSFPTVKIVSRLRSSPRHRNNVDRESLLVLKTVDELSRQYQEESDVICPVCSPSTVVWVPAEAATVASASAAAVGTDCSNRASWIQPLTTMTGFAEAADSGNPAVWNGLVDADDNDEDNDETKLTSNRSEFNGDRLDCRRHRGKAALSDQVPSESAAETDGCDAAAAAAAAAATGNTWYEIFDVVSRQDDWMTCASVFAVHWAYDGLRLAAATWLIDAGRQFQLKPFAIVWLTGGYFALSKAVYGVLRSSCDDSSGPVTSSANAEKAAASLLVRRPAILTAVGMLTVCAGFITIAATPPSQWSACLVAATVAVAVGSGLALAVSDAVMSARCCFRSDHLSRDPFAPSVADGGLLAADADEYGCDSDAIGRGGDGGAVVTHRRHDWVAVMRLGAGGVGMALLSVMAQQMLTNMSWMKGAHTFVACLSLPVLLTVFMLRSVASSVVVIPPRRFVHSHRRPVRLSATVQTNEFNTDDTKRTVADDVISYESDVPDEVDATSPLRMRVVQLVMMCAAAASFGVYVPFLLLPGEAVGGDVSKGSSAVLILVIMGATYSFGCLLSGAALVSSRRRHSMTSPECVISRRHFCQATSSACAAAIMLLVGAEGYTDRTLFAGIYGLLSGAFEYSLDAYWRECKSALACTVQTGNFVADYVTLAQVLPTLIGPVTVAYINSIRPGAGYFFAGVIMLTATVILFLVPCASNADQSHSATTTTTTNSRRHRSSELPFQRPVGQSLKHPEAENQRWQLTGGHVTPANRLSPQPSRAAMITPSFEGNSFKFPSLRIPPSAAVSLPGMFEPEMEINSDRYLSNGMYAERRQHCSSSSGLGDRANGSDHVGYRKCVIIGSGRVRAPRWSRDCVINDDDAVMNCADCCEMPSATIFSEQRV